MVGKPVQFSVVTVQLFISDMGDQLLFPYNFDAAKLEMKSI